MLDLILGSAHACPVSEVTIVFINWIICLFIFTNVVLEKNAQRSRDFLLSFTHLDAISYLQAAGGYEALQ